MKDGRKNRARKLYPRLEADHPRARLDQEFVDVDRRLGQHAYQFWHRVRMVGRSVDPGARVNKG